MTIHGVDVASPYQQGWTPNSLGSGSDDFVFVKATEGTTYRNPDRADQAAAGRDKGLQIGWYHWLTPGTSIDAQVDYFLTNAPMQDGDLLVCDWEQSGNTTAGKDQWIKAVQQARAGHKVGLYCNTNWWTTVDTSGFYGDFLWIAAYQSSKPDLQAAITFWQYTNTPIDQNHGYFSDRAALKAWAGGSSSTPSTAEQDPTEGSIQTPYGQQGTAWASGYHQGDDWHRSAGADEVGDPIWAVASGKIIYAGDARSDGGQGWGSSFGIHVLNQWDEHGRTSIDAHMSKLHVKTGDRVTVGDLIGEKGATGNVSGPHDHHEQHTGTGWTDPDVKPIYPGKPTSSSGTKPAAGDDLDMADHIEFHHRDPQKFGKADTYQWLRLDDDGDVSFITYPAKVIGGVLYLEISGLGSADSVNVYAGSYDVKKADSGNTTQPQTENHPDRITGVGSGWVHKSIPFAWQLGDQGKGYTYRALRWMVKSSTTKAKIENLRAEAWVVKQ